MKKLFESALYGVCLCAALLLAPVAGASNVDLRVLIDVSGSMKKNDPSNLRAPALRLLVNLLPEGASAGVWNFGEFVSPLVTHGKVDPKWKKKASKASNNITSRELFTDIEQALLVAVEDWKGEDPDTRRNIIVLTDGLVDVDHEEFLSQQSRRRILDEILPVLQKNGVAIHAIALSENADHELMKAMAVATDGGYEYARTADELNRIFVRLFEKSAPADTVPLRDNYFNVDAGIEDMTLLVFRGKDAPPTSVIPPTDDAFNQQNAPANVHWKSEQGYDLITVEKPEDGEWKIEAAIDPDNRVMVVTNLKLHSNKLPNNLLKEDRLLVSGWLTEDGERIERQDFLKLVEFKINPLVEGITEGEQAMLDDGEHSDESAEDGIYSIDMGELANPGNYLLIMTAKSGSFEREIKHTLTVHESPATIDVGQSTSGQDAWEIKVNVRKELVKLASVAARVRVNGGEQQEIDKQQETEWLMNIPQQSESQTVEVKVEGYLRNGRLFKLQIEKLVPALEVEPEPEAEPEPERPPVPLPGRPVEPEQEADVAEDEVPEEGVDWIIIGAVTLGANVILIPLLIFAYAKWRKRRQKQMREAEEALEL